MDTGKLTIQSEKWNKNSIYWVAALGNVRYGAENMPQVNTILCELEEGFDENNFSFQRDQLKRVPFIQEWIDIGYLVNMSMGSFVKKNRIIQPRKGRTKIKIDNLGYDTTIKRFPFNNILSLIKFKISDQESDPNTEGKQSYPDFGFPFYVHFGMPCLYYKDEASKQVYVIPCIEVARFYFCSSTNLAEKIFSGGIVNNHIFKPDQSDNFRNFKNNGNDFVFLAKYMLDENANEIARIAFYEEAFRAAKYVHGSIQQEYDSVNNSLNQSHYTRKNIGYPKTFFPFNHPGELEVNKIPMGTITLNDEFNGYNAFFVSRILKCHSEFLPNGCIFDRENDGRKGDSSNADENNKPVPPGEGPGDNFNGNNNAPTNLNSRGKKVIINDNKYPNGPSQELIIKKEKFEQKTVNVGVPIGGEDFDEDSLSNENDEDSEVGKGNITIDNEKKENNKDEESRKHSIAEYRQSFQLLIREFENAVNESDEGTQRLFNVSNGLMNFQPDQYKNLPQLFSKASINFARGVKKGGKNSWEGNRKAHVAKIAYSNTSKHFYLLDVYQRDGSSDPGTNIFVLSKDDFGLLGISTFNEIFFTMTKAKKVQLKPNELRHIRRETFKHEFTKPKNLYDRIITYLTPYYGSGK